MVENQNVNDKIDDPILEGHGNIHIGRYESKICSDFGISPTDYVNLKLKHNSDVINIQKNMLDSIINHYELLISNYRSKDIFQILFPRIATCQLFTSSIGHLFFDFEMNHHATSSIATIIMCGLWTWFKRD